MKSAPPSRNSCGSCDRANSTWSAILDGSQLSLCARTLMTRQGPLRLAVGQLSQAGPGLGFGSLDLEHAMVVRAAQLHVDRLAAVAMADHQRAPVA